MKFAQTVQASQTLAIPPVAMKWFGIGFLVMLGIFLGWYLWMRGRE